MSPLFILLSSWLLCCVQGFYIEYEGEFVELPLHQFRQKRATGGFNQRFNPMAQSRSSYAIQNPVGIQQRPLARASNYPPPTSSVQSTFAIANPVPVSGRHLSNSPLPMGRSSILQNQMLLHQQHSQNVYPGQAFQNQQQPQHKVMQTFQAPPTPSIYNPTMFNNVNRQGSLPLVQSGSLSAFAQAVRNSMAIANPVPGGNNYMQNPWMNPQRSMARQNPPNARLGAVMQYPYVTQQPSGQFIQPLQQTVQRANSMPMQFQLPTLQMQQRQHQQQQQRIQQQKQQQQQFRNMMTLANMDPQVEITRIPQNEFGLSSQAAASRPSLPKPNFNSWLQHSPNARSFPQPQNKQVNTRPFTPIRKQQLNPLSFTPVPKPKLNPKSITPLQNKEQNPRSIKPLQYQEINPKSSTQHHNQQLNELGLVRDPAFDLQSILGRKSKTNAIGTKPRTSNQRQQMQNNMLRIQKPNQQQQMQNNMLRIQKPNQQQQMQNNMLRIQKPNQQQQMQNNMLRIQKPNQQQQMQNNMLRIQKPNQQQQMQNNMLRIQKPNQQQQMQNNMLGIQKPNQQQQMQNNVFRIQPSNQQQRMQNNMFGIQTSNQQQQQLQNNMLRIQTSNQQRQIQSNILGMANSNRQLPPQNIPQNLNKRQQMQTNMFQISSPNRWSQMQNTMLRMVNSNRQRQTPTLINGQPTAQSATVNPLSTGQRTIGLSAQASIPLAQQQVIDQNQMLMQLSKNANAGPQQTFQQTLSNQPGLGSHFHPMN
ncbi:transcription factor SPT20 homolog [Gigantopelta aegis]|uniref:transcription factor SPT20 homolog n=1 Tax=Gigantopelta aegis TaxID=1735272 RepID=UPI001B88BEAD|nr:transcription factor SPT20 homolog [Gigantopelta aegis]XP_041348658.1 transcription factor SPT20 homolog [Gigantopelta aegis]